MSVSDIKIVIIRALGYSGATWFNTVLGCHPDTMAMGPTTRLHSISEMNPDEACFIHREKCNLWPRILGNDDIEGRLFETLAEESGEKVFILNYPPKPFIDQEITGKGFQIFNIKFVRDGRANLFSKLRHDVSKKSSHVLETILKWQIPKWDQIDRKIHPFPDETLLVRYEDMLAFPETTLGKVSSFLSLSKKYAGDATQFWKYEHHMTAGNTAVIDTICKMQNVTGWNHHREGEYDQYIESLKQDPKKQFEDNQWENGFSREDLIVFDCLLGERNARHGYSRDEITEEEKDKFWHNLHVCGQVFQEMNFKNMLVKMILGAK